MRTSLSWSILTVLLPLFIDLPQGPAYPDQERLTGGKQNGALRTEQLKVFHWFDGLAFPDVKGCPFVRAATGSWSEAGDGSRRNTYIHGFLLDERGNAFTILTSSVGVTRLVKTKSGTAEYERIGYERRDLASFAGEYLKSLREIQKSPDNDIWRRFGEQMTERAEVFFVAWGCWRNGLDRLAADLFDHAAAMPGYQRGRRHEAEGKTFQQKLAGDVAHAEMWRATLDFGDPSITRAQLLERFERFTRNFPESEHAPRAREAVALLRQMVKEDEQHARERRTGKPFGQLGKREQIAELIFQLRDQNGHQFSQPGECDIFLAGDWTAKDSPAHRLVKMGYDAVPQLIEVLEDRRFSRSIGFHRDFYFSHFVLRVGDCAEQILSRIAHRSFFVSKSTFSYMLKDGEGAAVKKQVQGWFAELQKKGEKQTLIDETAKGHEDSPAQGALLLQKYPEEAGAAIIRGARAAKRSGTRARLVALAGKVKSDAAAAFLLSELKQGRCRSSRLAAARALHERGRPEGVAAMITEWQGQRAAVNNAGVSPSDEPEDDAPLESIAEFLAHSGKVEAIAALGKDLRKRPISLRADVVSAFGKAEQLIMASSGPGGGLLAGHGGTPQMVREAVEKLLIAELDDIEERTGMSGTWNGKQFSDPRICDIAGQVLSQLDPTRYPFDLSASLARRDRNIVLLKNNWRKAHGQPPLPLPVARKVIPVADEKLEPLVAKLLATPSADRAGVQREIEQFGVAALPGVLKRLQRISGQDKQAREILDRLAHRLACSVTEVRLAEESLKPSAALAARLEAMKGKPFEPALFVQAIGSLMKQWPKQVHALRFSGDRGDDAPGIILTVDLLAETRAARLGRSGWMAPDENSPKDLPYSWHFSQRVTAGKEELLGGNGIGRGEEWTKGDYPELREALTKACEAPIDQPLTIRIQLIAEWVRSSGKTGSR